jgi:hypothetical protein
LASLKSVSDSCGAARKEAHHKTQIELVKDQRNPEGVRNTLAVHVSHWGQKDLNIVNLAVG